MLESHLDKFFLEYQSHLFGKSYFAGDYQGPWTRELDKAKGFKTQRGAEKAVEKLKNTNSDWAPKNGVQIIRVVSRPVVEVLIGNSWHWTHPDR